MTIEVVTPISQAMREGALTRPEMKLLMRRSDRPALLRLVAWFVLIGLTGSLISLSRDSLLFVPAMFIHGVVLVHHFSLQHECCHYTAFRTRWLNDLAGNFCALVIMLPHKFFRYEHCDHHTHTQVKGKDTELIELPGSIAGYLWYLSSIPYWKTKFSELGRHAAGHLTAEDKQFVPVSERRAIVAEARWMLAFYVTVGLVCVTFSIDELLWYWLVPVLLGEPVMRAIRMTEHVGRPTVGDMKVNTRSNRIGLVWRFLCWNNNYHAEHHYASSVPFHALPALSEKLRGFIHTEDGGYLGAHRDILDQLLGRKPRCDQPHDA